MAERIYLVTDTETNSGRLIMCNTPTQAVKHCIGDRFKTKAATSLEVARMMAGGAEVEKPTAKSAPEA